MGAASLAFIVYTNQRSESMWRDSNPRWSAWKADVIGRYTTHALTLVVRIVLFGIITASEIIQTPTYLSTRILARVNSVCLKRLVAELIDPIENTLGGTRTHTEQILSLLSLPIGLRGQKITRGKGMPFIYQSLAD